MQRQYFDKSSIMCCADYACGMVKIGKNVPSATSSFLRKYITDRETDEKSILGCGLGWTVKKGLG